MSERGKKIRNGIVIQGGILAAAGLIARAIGIVRRIPLTNIIGDVGNGYYAAAYELYAIILLLSSYSLPLAVSKMVAARVSRGQYKNAKKIFKASLVFATISGGLACLIVLFFADFLAGSVMGEPMSATALRVLAPTLLIVAVMGVFRGYFQGLGTMTPTAISQIVEQIFLVVFSLLFAQIAFGRGTLYGNLMMSDRYAPAQGAAGATLGCGIGALAGLCFLLMVYLASRKNMLKAEHKDVTRANEDYASIFRVLILTIVPVLISSVMYNVCGVLDQIMYNHYMLGIGQEELKTFNWGVYSGKYKVLINLPIALASAMCSAIVPSLSASFANHDVASARSKVASAIRATMMITIPSAVGLAVLGKPIVDMLFSGEVDLAGQMLLMGTLSVVFYALSTLGNGILQGIGKMYVPIINAAIALAVHLLTLWAMLYFMKLDIMAVVFSNIIFSLVMFILNHLAIRKFIGYRQELNKTFIIPLLVSAVMGGVSFGIYHLFRLFLPVPASCMIALVVAVVIYFAGMIALKGFRESELVRVPLLGRPLVNLLKRFGVM
ncbi:MAG: polysaccharide biosynthesis protein [Lachnospiraceae bacterium]|nr:polysaccharide biosynthesis protein [Lachnospiraceae bacterium]